MVTQFQFSTVDGVFSGPLPPSAGNQHNLLIGDHFTKWHEAAALPDQSAPATSRVVADQWITRFGCPESRHSDQGRNSEARFFASLTKLLQPEKTRTTVFHPQSTAVIERTNRTLLNTLAETMDKNQRNRSVFLPNIMLAHRISIHKSTCFTLYFLLFGHKSTLPIDLQFHHQVVLPGPTITSTSQRHDSSST